MNRRDPELRALEDSELSIAALTLTRSFDDDPLFVYMLPNPRRRALWLEWFHRTALGEAMRIGQVWVIGSPHEGAIAVFPPHGYPAPLGTSWHAIPMLPTFPTPRLVRCGLAAEWRTRKLHPTFPHLYVRVLGVDPTCKGRGLGGALLEKAITDAKALAIPVYLETSNPENLSFYKRFGFEVREDITDYGGPPIWTLATKSV